MIEFYFYWVVIDRGELESVFVVNGFYDGIECVVFELVFCFFGGYLFFEG